MPTSTHFGTFKSQKFDAFKNYITFAGQESNLNPKKILAIHNHF